MQSNFQLLLLLCIMTLTTHAQNDERPILNISDPAPALRVRGWIKGTPIKRFERGHVYVIELWATWCAPCRAAMPHLSRIADEYKGRVSILGVDVMEDKTITMRMLKEFVDSMGQRMGYSVAVEDSNFVIVDWYNAAGEQSSGIPRTFVVDTDGRLAWIGHPKDLAEVLPKIVNNTWNVKEALAKRNSDKYLAHLDDSLNYELLRYDYDMKRPGIDPKRDSTLMAIDKFVRTEPRLKYAPHIAYRTFASLLYANPDMAYEYGKVVIVTPTYEGPAYDAIIGAIETYSGKLILPTEIYQLGIRAYIVKIDQTPYPETANMPKYYSQMANWYWRTRDKSKAIDSMKKAIESLKSRKDFSSSNMAVYESELQEFKKMQPK